MTTTIEKFVTDLGFRYDKSGLRGFEARLKSVRAGLNNVARSAGRVGFAIAGAAAGAVLEFASFETELAKIEGLVGVNRDVLDGWQDDIKSIAAETGAGPKKLAEALFFVTSAGLRGSDAIDVLRASAKGAAAGLGDQATLADLATSAMNAYGPSVLSAQQSMDALTEAVRVGKLEPAELAGAMGRVLPVASAMGVSFNEVAGLMAAMSKTGTDAQSAVTQLNAVMSGLLKPSAGAEKAFERIGSSADEMRAMMAERGLFETLVHLKEALGGNNQAFAEIFPNVRALRGIFDLMGPQLDSNRALIDEMAESTGVLDEAFGAQTKTVAFKWKQAMSAIRVASMELGAALAPLAVQVAEWARQLVGWFNRQDTQAGIREFVDGVTSAAAVVGPALLAVVAAVRVLAGWMDRLGFGVKRVWVVVLALGPVLLAVAAAAKVGAIAVGVFQAVMVAARGAAAAYALAVKAAAASTGLLGSAAVGTRIGVMALAVAQWAGAVAAKAAAAAQWILNAAVAAFPLFLVVAAVAAAVAAIWYFRDEIAGFAGRVWDAITGVFERLRDWLAAHWPKLLAVMFPLAAVGVMLSQMRDRIWSAITGMFERLRDWLAAHWPKLLAVMFPLAAVGVMLSQMRDRIWSAITGMFERLRDWLAAHWPKLLAVMFPLAAVGVMLSRMRDRIWSAITGMFERLRDWLAAHWPKLLAVMFPLAAVGVMLYRMRDRIWSAITGVFENLRDWFTGLTSAYFDAGKALVMAIADGILAAAKAPYDAAKKALGFVRDLLPFSDAREGPLSQLTESGRRIGKTIAGGVRGDDLASAMNRIIPDPAALLAPLPVGPVPVAAAAPAGTGQRTFNLTVGDIRVDAPGGDPDVIASELTGKLESQFRRLVEDLDSDIES